MSGSDGERTAVATEGEGSRSKQRQSATAHPAVRRGAAMLAATNIASSNPPGCDSTTRSCTHVHLGVPRGVSYIWKCN